MKVLTSESYRDSMAGPAAGVPTITAIPSSFAVLRILRMSEKILQFTKKTLDSFLSLRRGSDSKQAYGLRFHCHAFTFDYSLLLSRPTGASVLRTSPSWPRPFVPLDSRHNLASLSRHYFHQENMQKIYSKPGGAFFHGNPDFAILYPTSNSLFIYSGSNISFGFSLKSSGTYARL